MWEKIIDRIFENPLMLIFLVPFIMTVPTVHFLKVLFKNDDPAIKTIKVFFLAFLVSNIYTVPVWLVWAFPDIIGIVVIQFVMPAVSTMLSVGFVVMVDKAIEAGLLTSFFEFIKGFLKKKE